MVRKFLLACVFLSASLLPNSAQNRSAAPAPDDRYKADILLVLAHPDDDTDVSTYLWKAVLDEGKRVAVVYTTRGNSGGNAAGMEQSKTLAEVREIDRRSPVGRFFLAPFMASRGQCTFLLVFLLWTAYTYQSRSSNSSAVKR